jgi:hypothetical protein
MRVKKYMKLQIFSIIICLILISTLIPQTIKGENNTNKELMLETNVESYVEHELDQKQLLNDGYVSIHSNTWVAQSFKPSKTPLTKILIKINKNIVINSPLEFSIRSDLNSNEIIYTQLQSNQIPYYTNWVEIDFEDIEVVVGNTYYMVLRTNSPSGQSYKWLDKLNTTGDPYESGKQYISINNGFEWEPTESDSSFIDSTFQTFTYKSKPILNCIGFFNWTDIEPASTVTGTFIVENIGTPLSNLDWEISNWPYWGVWTFDPKSGSNLKPEDGLEIVSFSFRAPNVSNSRYDGQITITNVENDSNYCTIETSLITPKHSNDKFFDLFNIIDQIKKNFIFFRNIIFYQNLILDNKF